jgi:hypothetical protein
VSDLTTESAVEAAALRRTLEAAHALSEAQRERRDAIRDAVRLGCSESRIAAHAGITRQRVWQIANDR